ncbi:MAG: winged helix-turn-helix domain-containing protein [Gammaproteobacteria bacterium]
MPLHQFDQFVFDPADGRLEHQASGTAVTLRPQVARLLLVLLRAPRTVIDRETLYLEIWGKGAVVDFESGLAALARELRQALDQLGGRADLLETVPRRGFRFGADVRQWDTAPAASRGMPQNTPGSTPGDPRGRTPLAVRRRPSRWLLLGALAAAMALAWLLARWVNAPPVTPATEGWTLAVLPFERFDDAPPGAARLELLLADALLVELWRAQLDGAELMGRATLLPYQAREDVAGAVARDLGVRLLIEGSMVHDGADWQVSARLLEMPAGRVMWSATVEWPGVVELPVRESATRLVEDLEEAWAQSDKIRDLLGTTD